MTSLTAVSGAKWRVTWSVGAVVEGLGRLAYLVVVFGPVAALLLATLRWLPGQWSAAAALVLPLARLPLLARSLGLSLGVATGCVVVGGLVASVLWRWRTGRKAQLRWLILVLAPVPAYVHALAWTSAAFALNQWLAGHGLPELPLQGVFGAAWVQVMALLPLTAALCLLALDTVPVDLVDAGRLLRGDWGMLRRVALPLAAPMILAAGGIAFALSLLDYSVPALFQVSVYALAVFAEYSATNEPVRAFLMAVPIMVAAAVAVLVAQRGLRRAAHRPERARPTRGAPFAWPRWLVVLQVLACAAMVAQVAVPLISLTRTVGSVMVFGDTVTSAGREVTFSLLVALVAAILCLPLALVAARRLVRRDRVGRAWWLLVTLPLAIPAPLIGIGLIAVWNRSWLGGVYGSAAMPVLAALARFTPIAALILLSQLRRVDPLLIDAARVLAPSATQAWLRVRLPLLAPGLLAAACVTFALTLGELGATLIVAAPGDQTLTMRIYNYLHFGASDTVAGLCLAMALAAVMAGLLAALVLTGWSRLTRVPAGGEG